jgi:hypothetical protein
MKKKIGIITILKVNNYGAELQAYATQKALQLMGYDAEIIDYLFYKNPRHKRTKMSAPTAKMSIKKRLQEFLFPIMANWKARHYRKAQEMRNAKFEQFHKDNTKLSVCYDTLDKLKAAKLDYDVLVSGSDQVWNPGIYSCLDPYLLRFGTEKMKRIAYASSFGVSSLPEDVKEYYKEALQAYSAISVREDKAVDIVKRVSGCNAQLVLDPTLLLNKDQWLEVAKPVENLPGEPFVLIYELSNIPYIKQVAKYISEQTGMPIVRICKNASVEDSEKDIINIIDAGPAEFLYLLNKAGYVVTNSFHGTAFSINFNKQFYTIIPKGKSNNSRQRSILKLMACEDRMLIEDSAMPEIKVCDTKKVSMILQNEREKSMNYLKTAIDGE